MYLIIKILILVITLLVIFALIKLNMANKDNDKPRFVLDEIDDSMFDAMQPIDIDYTDEDIFNSI